MHREGFKGYFRGDATYVLTYVAAVRFVTEVLAVVIAVTPQLQGFALSRTTSSFMN